MIYTASNFQVPQLKIPPAVNVSRVIQRVEAHNLTDTIASHTLLCVCFLPLRLRCLSLVVYTHFFSNELTSHRFLLFQTRGSEYRGYLSNEPGMCVRYSWSAHSDQSVYSSSIGYIYLKNLVVRQLNQKLSPKRNVRYFIESGHAKNHIPFIMAKRSARIVVLEDR